MFFRKLIAACLIGVVAVTACSGATTPDYRVTYYVQEGDTLSSIAETYGVTASEIMAANNITDPDKIAAGQPLIMPLALTPSTPKPMVSVVPTSTPVPTPAPLSVNYVLYFYFGVNCENSRAMAPKVEQFYREYGKIADAATRQAKDSATLASPSIQVPGPVDVIGVRVSGWGTDVAEFRRVTGITFPVGNDPGLGVDTRQIPVTAIYNKETKVSRVATVGNVSYAGLESKVNDVIIEGTSSQPAPGWG